MAGRKPKVSYTEKGQGLLDSIGLDGVQAWELGGRPVEGTLTSRVLTSLVLIMAEHDPQSRFSPGSYYRVFMRTGRVCPSDVKPCMADAGLAIGHSNVALMVRVLHRWAAVLDVITAAAGEGEKVTTPVIELADAMLQGNIDRVICGVSMLSRMQTAVEDGDLRKQQALAKDWIRTYFKVRGKSPALVLYDRCTDRPIRLSKDKGRVTILGVEFPVSWALLYAKRGVEYGAL